MSGKKYGAPLRLEPQISLMLAVVFAVSLGGAITLPFLVSVPIGVRLVVLAAIAGVGYDAYRYHFGSRRIVHGVWDEHDGWQIRLAEGSEWEVRLGGETFFVPEVMILNFHADTRRFPLVIVWDTLDAESRRRLRVRLRWEARARAATQVSGAAAGKSPADG